MGKGHGDRLTSLDASFLHMEAANQHMHVGGLFVFDGSQAPAFDFSRFLELIRSRLHLVPRYRQRLAFAPLNLSNPVWVDDRSFDLSFHVRHAALPAPGTIQQLTGYAARILSRPLDRDRPLWELYVIEGVEEGSKFAVLGKNHHAMIDGVAGIDIATVMLDFDPNQSDEIPEPEPWVPDEPPRGYELAWSTVRDLATTPREAIEAGRRLLRTPGRVVRRAYEVTSGLANAVASGVPRPAPPSSLNRPPGVHRRFAVQRLPLETFKRIKNTYSTTVNDVVLAVVADATGRFLRSRGEDTDGLWLKAMVPVSVRADGGEDLGNKVASVFINLPMFEMDPVERLEVCQAAMQDVKEHHQAAGADFLIGLSRFAAPTIQAAASRAAARGRLFNFLVSNVPGPQVPIYCMGARLLGAFPFVPLASHHSYGVALTSIDGWLNFGFTADWDALPDIENVTGCLTSSLDELVEHAAAAGVRSELARKQGASAPTGPSEVGTGQS